MWGVTIPHSPSADVCDGIDLVGQWRIYSSVRYVTFASYFILVVKFYKMDVVGLLTMPRFKNGRG